MTKEKLQKETQLELKAEDALKKEHEKEHNATMVDLRLKFNATVKEMGEKYEVRLAEVKKSAEFAGFKIMMKAKEDGRKAILSEFERQNNRLKIRHRDAHKKMMEQKVKQADIKRMVAKEADVQMMKEASYKAKLANGVAAQRVIAKRAADPAYMLKEGVAKLKEKQERATKFSSTKPDQLSMKGLSKLPQTMKAYEKVNKFAKGIVDESEVRKAEKVRDNAIVNTRAQKEKNEKARCVVGLISGRACCPNSCGTCGGADCAKAPGGASVCCPAEIMKKKVSCSTASAPPCVVDQDIPVAGAAEKATAAVSSQKQELAEAKNSGAKLHVFSGSNVAVLDGNAKQMYNPLAPSLGESGEQVADLSDTAAF